MGRSSGASRWEELQVELVGRLQVRAGEAPIKGGGRLSYGAPSLPQSCALLAERAARTHHGSHGKPVALDVNYILLAR